MAIALNDHGWVVGSADTTKGYRHAYLWRGGVMTDLGTLGSILQSEAWDVNNEGQITGKSSNTDGLGRAFLWQDGVMTEIGSPTNPKSAHAINEKGQIAGQFVVPPVGNVHAFLWEDGVMTDLGTLGGTNSIAWDINEAGQVVGESFVQQGGERAFLWQGGAMADLGTLGAGNSEAFGISDLGQVVDRSQRSIEDENFHAFVWQDGDMADLGAVLGVSNSRADKINNHGQVLALEFLYDPKVGAFPLDDLIPPGSGWAMLWGRDINDRGQICGDGTINGQRHAFLMTPLPPVPAASSYGVIALGAGLLALGVCILLRRRAAPSAVAT